ncbi:MAG: sensor histidine kinase [Flavobacteriales bacterium]
MKKKAKFIFYGSVLVVVGLIATQFFIVKNSLEIDNENRQIVKEIKELENKNFSTEVTLALTKVRDKLISTNKENSNIYLDPVKQIQDNYFVVSFYDTISQTLLKNLVVQEFSNFYINKSYKIGVYDCFTDSLIFDEFTSESEVKNVIKWDHDGYYFGVYFNNFKIQKIEKTSSFPYMIILASLIFILGTLLAFYLARDILKQKKISKITYDFINNMTHELKTPISTISLSTDVLLSNEEITSNERLNRYLGIIKTENKRLENQVERVLQIAKLDKDVIKLNFEPIDIHTVIKTCVKTFSVPIQDREGEIITSLNAQNPVIKGDITHITNIIYNLLDNANKYSKEKPTIEIKTENRDGKLKISIKDQGIGIKKEDIQEIFQKFYRVSTGDVHNVKGFGLGLYYVKQMMEKHNGNIEIVSKFNLGSEFILSFPLQN